ncbi:MAG: fructosamine kinase family protein [Chitinophagaceae bacterium]
MALNDLLKINIEKEWQIQINIPVKIKQTFPINGGDICLSYRMETDRGTFFLKSGKANTPQDLFEKEFEGLQLLSKSNTIAVPRPLVYLKSGTSGFLVMEFIHKSHVKENFWEIFAEKLALLHQTGHSHFGLERDNYIGILPQVNNLQKNWTDFYAFQRLEPLIKRCVDDKMLPLETIGQSANLYKKLPEIFPDEKPALIHGDLWGGNFLPSADGNPFIFDPATYFGNREMDLAMTRLFGGFDRKFYWHYQEMFPLQPGWAERIEICQLYYLLVHAVLFGGGYVQRVRKILEGF